MNTISAMLAAGFALTRAGKLQPPPSHETAVSLVFSIFTSAHTTSPGAYLRCGSSSVTRTPFRSATAETGSPGRAPGPTAPPQADTRVASRPSPRRIRATSLETSPASGSFHRGSARYVADPARAQRELRARHSSHTPTYAPAPANRTAAQPG